MTQTSPATSTKVRVATGLIAALLTVGLTGCGNDSDSDNDTSSGATTSTTTANGNKQTDGDPTTTATTAATSSTVATNEPTVDLTAAGFGDIALGATEQAVREGLSALKADITSGITPPCFGKADSTISAGSVQFAITGGKLTGYWVDSTFGMGFPTALTVLGGQRFLGSPIADIKPVGLSAPAETVETDGTIIRSMTDTEPPFRVVAEPSGMVLGGGVAPDACVATG